MQRQADWATGKLGLEDISLSYRSDTEAYFGRLNEARELSRQAMDSAERAGEKETAGKRELNGALREAEFGNLVEARGHASHALEVSSARSVRVLAALVLARTGDTEHADRMVQELQRQNPLNSKLTFYWLPVIRAAIQISRKNPHKALEILQTTIPFRIGSSRPATGNRSIAVSGIADKRI
jgi:hypothetical protein